MTPFTIAGCADTHWKLYVNATVVHEEDIGPVFSMRVVELPDGLWLAALTILPGLYVTTTIVPSKDNPELLRLQLADAKITLLDELGKYYLLARLAGLHLAHYDTVRYAFSESLSGALENLESGGVA